ncbi:Multifunctional conjugation protein TraI [Kluyvera ascorbata]|nr:hypothetical protein WP4W18E05_P11170 [Klebsiella sp. WP4-W18-ESBL-05]BCA42544.1 hypothetical protein KATP_50660 [Kluyvera ascorbata]STX01548.1 Multifunctional conjugation protein TraI [Kluyvera ascorbata]
MLEAHNQAVQIAAGYVEKLVSARDTHDGITSIVPTGKMVAAAFTHDTSRNLDPQLHTHLIVANMTESQGKWKALATDYIHNAGFIETVMKMQVTLGKIYRNALRERVEALGHEVEEVGPHGMWEIKGVPEEVREEFSSRGKEIEGAVGAEATLRSRDVAAKDTRQAKVDPSRMRLMERWTRQMAEKGFDIAGYMDTAAERAETLNSADREPQSTLIIEGAERLGLKETLVLLGEAREKDAQLIFLDSAGRQANGNAMSVLESAGVNRTRYNVQTTGLETTVNSIADKRTRYDALASRYAELSGGQETVTAVVVGQREQKHLTSLIRDALQNSGQLERDGVTVEARVPVWLDSKTRRMTGSFKPGQVLEDRSDKKETRHFVIDRVHEDTRVLSLIDQDGVLVRQKLNELTSDWRLFNREEINISAGEKLIAVATDKSAGFKAKDRLTVSAVSDSGLTVEHKGKFIDIKAGQPLYRLWGSGYQP